MSGNGEADLEAEVNESATSMEAMDKLVIENENLRKRVSELQHELDDRKSSITVAECVMENVVELEKEKLVLNQELATLRTLLKEAQDMRMSYEHKFAQIQAVVQQLEHENQDLKIRMKISENMDKETLLPTVLSDVTKSLARKVKSNLQTVIVSNKTEVDGGLQKAYEDSELLKAIVLPLEEQIGALKDKLRETDALLREQDARHANILLSTPELASWLSGQSVDEVLTKLKEKEPEVKDNEFYIGLINVRYGLLNKELEALKKEHSEIRELLAKEHKNAELYKSQALSANSKLLNPNAEISEEPEFRIVSKTEWAEITDLISVNEEESIKELKEEVRKQAVLTEKYREDLMKESIFRKEVESKWNDRSERHKTETEALAVQVRDLENLLEQLRTSYSTIYEATRNDLKSLTTDREKIVREVKRLQDENDHLFGKYKARAEEFQNEVIDLPDKLEDIHTLLLSYREDLIAAKIAKEFLEEKLKSEVNFLKSRLAGEQQAKESLEDEFNAEIQGLREKVQMLESYKSEFEAERKRRMEFEGINADMEALLAEKDELLNQRKEFIARISNLQQELDNSVAVQTDFVRLSQSLQMELEKIRQAEKEVRWQHEDDADYCQNCKCSFSVTKRKHHCRHCGKIFCTECVSKTVPCGPSRRPARVCDVCHTLLVSDSAPYFSTEPPSQKD